MNINGLAGAPMAATSPWKGSRIMGRWFDIGEWLVIGTEGQWLKLEPRNPLAQTLAALDPTGVLWIQKRDAQRVPNQKEQLL